MGCSSHFSLLHEVVQSLREACSKEVGLTNNFHITGLISVSSHNLSTASFIIDEHAKPSTENAAELFWDGSSFHAMSSLSLVSVPNSEHATCNCRCCVCVQKDGHHVCTKANTILNLESGWSQVSVHKTHSHAYPAPGGGLKEAAGGLQTAQPLPEKVKSILQRENSVHCDMVKCDESVNKHFELPERCHSILLSKNSTHNNLDDHDGSGDQHFSTSDSMDCEENENLGVLVIDMNGSCKDTVLCQDDQTVKNHVNVNDSLSCVDMPVSAAVKNFTHALIRSRKSKSSASMVRAPHKIDAAPCQPESSSDHAGDAKHSVHVDKGMPVIYQPLQDHSSGICEDKQSVLVKVEPDNDRDREDRYLKNNFEEEPYDSNGIHTAQIKVEPADSSDHIAIPLEECRFSYMQASDTLKYRFGGLRKQNSVHCSQVSSNNMEQNLEKDVLSEELHKTSHPRQAKMLAATTASPDATEKPENSSRNEFHSWGTHNSTSPVISSTVSLAGFLTSQKEWEDQWPHTIDAQTSSSLSFDTAGRELHLDRLQATAKPVTPVMYASSRYEEREFSNVSKLSPCRTRYKEIRPKEIVPDFVIRPKEILPDFVTPQQRSVWQRRKKHFSSRGKRKQTSSQPHLFSIGAVPVSVFQLADLGGAQIGPSESSLQTTNIFMTNASSIAAVSPAYSGSQSHHIPGILPPQAHPFTIGGGIENQSADKIALTGAQSADSLTSSSEKAPSTTYLVNGSSSYLMQSLTSTGQIQVRHLNFGSTELLPWPSGASRAETQQNCGVTLSSMPGKNAKESCEKTSFSHLPNSISESVKKFKPILPKQAVSKGTLTGNVVFNTLTQNPKSQYMFFDDIPR